jgi:hypothetical protein|tara:strand:- start:419 stop:652 length:234 start_codon:yes stop_codon:yes gene_type:complete
MMPTYTMINVSNNEEKEMFMSVTERDEFLSNGEYKQKLITPTFISQHGSTHNKAGDGWKDVLRRVKSGAGRDNSIDV